MSFFPWRKTRQANQLEELQTNLQKTEGRVRDEREFIRAILGSMFEGVLVISPEGKVLFANPVFTGIFGAAGEKNQGRRYWEIFRHEKLHGLLEKALTDRQGVQGGIELYFPEERHFQVQVSPIRAGENFLGVVLILHDVSSMKRMERMRTEFVANVSHELKTPLASIIGAAETLRGGALEDVEHRDGFLEMIERHSADLQKLIEDLLDLARLESGSRRLEKEPAEVAPLFEDLKRTFGARAASKKIDLTFQSDAGTVRCSRESVRRALSNLIENAIKYTDAGGRVRVEARTEGEEAVFKVEDSGAGIPLEDQARIFERFYRSEKSRTRDAGGSGLGLSIVKHIAETHGGRVDVQSEPSKGSTFTFRIPSS